MSATAFGEQPGKEYIDKLKEKKLANINKKEKTLTKLLGSLPLEDLSFVDRIPQWSVLDIDGEDWLPMDLPGYWESKGLSGFDGVIWFKKNIELKEVRGSYLLNLGQIDDSDICWINGVKVGETKNQRHQSRQYIVDANVLKKGTNTIIVRVEDVLGKGGFYGSIDSLYLAMERDILPLSGKWEYKIGKFNNEAQKNSLTSEKRMESVLYNKMIHPLTKFSIKGVLWYQGEGNRGKEGLLNYERYFKTQIKDWRKTWNIGKFPFLYVQLPNYGPLDTIPTESSWAAIREAQLNTLAVENTGMAVTIDLGSILMAHPKNKQDVGYRLALIARNKIYGETDLIFSGPTLQKMESIGDKIYLDFDNVGEGLIIKKPRKYNNKLRGFAIAGADKKFVWAQANIVNNNQVVVWNEEIKKPKYVRYGWGDNPVVNLYNSEGLPASPFRISLTE